MRKALVKALIILTLSFSLQSVFGSEIPIVSMEQFKVGNYWTWTYFTDGDFSQPYSTERYQVISVEGSRLSFEIWSQYQNRGDFKPSAKFQVNFTQCKQAFLRPDLKVNFLIHLFPWQNGAWASSSIPTLATAFEEKFNCNPVIHTKKSSMYETRFETLETAEGSMNLFQQWPKYSNSQLKAFYYLDHPQLKGIAFKKSFNPGTIGYYEARLTDWSM
jgi:hypothetical protein